MNLASEKGDKLIEERKEGANDDESGIGETLGDHTLALTLRQAIIANCNIDGLNDKLIEQLEAYQENYREQTRRIKQLERDLPRTKNLDRRKMMETRLKAANKLRGMSEQ